MIKRMIKLRRDELSVPSDQRPQWVEHKRLRPVAWWK